MRAIDLLHPPKEEGSRLPAAIALLVMVLASAMICGGGGPAAASAEPAIADQAGAISGRVLAPDGQPVAGATVKARVRGAEDEDGEARATTNRHGAFSFAILDTGAYELRVEARGYLLGRLEVTVAAGAQVKGVEARLVPGAVLLGCVRDSAGSPVAGAKVHLEGGKSFAPDGASGSVTDAQGSYRLDGIEPGERSLSMGLGGIWTPQERVVIAPGVQRRDLTLPRREIRGRVLSPAGAPVAGATVELRSRDLHRRETSSGPGGTFAFAVFDGWFLLNAAAVGFGPGELREPLRIHGASRSGVEIRLQRTAISGHVTGLSGAELAAAGVNASRSDRNLYLSSPVDAAGGYRIDHLAPGVWQLWAASGEKRIDREIDLTDADEQVVDIAFPAYFAVSGRVLKADGRPAKLQGLRFDDLAHPAEMGIFPSVDIGPQGSFSVLLPSGSYRIAGEVAMATYRFAKEPLLVSAAPRRGVEIRLDAMGTITGHLVGLAVGEYVHVEASQGGLDQWGEVDTEGRYTISGLPIGEWEVAVWNGAATVRATVSLTADHLDASLDIPFRAGPLTLSGRLAGIDPSGRYIVTISDTQCCRSADVKADGKFRIPGLTAGRYEIEVRDDEMPVGAHWPLYHGEVDLEADRDVVLQLSLPP